MSNIIFSWCASLPPRLRGRMLRCALDRFRLVAFFLAVSLLGIIVQILYAWRLLFGLQGFPR